MLMRTTLFVARHQHMLFQPFRVNVAVAARLLYDFHVFLSYSIVEKHSV